MFDRSTTLRWKVCLDEPRKKQHESACRGKCRNRPAHRLTRSDARGGGREERQDRRNSNTDNDLSGSRTITRRVRH